MIELTETTIGMAFAVVGIVGTVLWYGLALYGIKTLRDVRDTVDSSGSAE